jgi:LPS sulfotransferase NodH
MVSTKLLENIGMRSHHDRSPSNTKSGQENPRSYLVRDNCRGWLEDGVRDEENQSRNRVSVAYVGSKVVMHASDCGVWPNRLLEKYLMWLVAGGDLHVTSIN